MKYKILAVSSEEYAKTDIDYDYVPQEYIVTVVECEEWEIDRILRSGLKSGAYPCGSQYTESE